MLRSLIPAVAADLQFDEKKSDDEGQSSIPIVFICHSMGGLIVKSAMEIASNPYCEDTYIHQLYQRTLGFVFYSTPHRGSDIANLYKSFAKYLPYIGPSKSIENLKKDNSFLVNLLKRFNNLIAKHPIFSKTYPNRKCILSLIEGQGQPELDYAKVVDTASSMTASANEISVTMDYYHTIICQPAGFEDP